MSTETELPLFMNPELPKDRPALPDDFGVGSSVVVIPPRHRRNADWSAMPGEVTKKARVWVTVKATHSHYGNAEYRMRLDTQDEGDRNYLQYNTKFVTPQQHEWDGAHFSAQQYLMNQGVRVDQNSPWWHRPVELARVLWTAEQETKDAS